MKHCRGLTERSPVKVSDVGGVTACSMATGLRTVCLDWQMCCWLSDGRAALQGRSTVSLTLQQAHWYRQALQERQRLRLRLWRRQLRQHGTDADARGDAAGGAAARSAARLLSFAGPPLQTPPEPPATEGPLPLQLQLHAAQPSTDGSSCGIVDAPPPLHTAGDSWPQSSSLRSRLPSVAPARSPSDEAGRLSSDGIGHDEDGWGDAPPPPPPRSSAREVALLTATLLACNWALAAHGLVARSGHDAMWRTAALEHRVLPSDTPPVRQASRQTDQVPPPDEPSGIAQAVRAQSGASYGGGGWKAAPVQQPFKRIPHRRSDL